ncbi:MAG TPA: circularly permuted type 2 ATP-grasp protein [Roseimicrobium sp.]|nr:circularly permuted type 2 ATP-grasp protein [Roseimicrobium sp.]
MSSTAPASASAGRKGILSAYSPSGVHYDEMFLPDGRPREHAARFLDALSGMGAEALKRCDEISRRIIHEQGVTYNVYGDALGVTRPWQLDPIPYVISQQEWRTIESALIQRATLINQVLADCYGPQSLIHSGGLPPALVFAQPDFLRPCHGIPMPDSTYLHFYAADLARSPDGQWWVVSDRTQIPTGAGYTLANRLVTSRLFPDLFSELHVQRLAGFFRQLQDSLVQLSRRRADNPRVVLLTPGPYNETYFEQAYLARYLGYSLVEGQDLTVRDDNVFLKTLSGLEPVDVILRRVDDDYCDPLELRNNSILGVPGLVEACRAGNVVIANALGSGLLQSAAFMSFLPGLCRHMLGEELKMPSVATWWCGQASAQKYVTERLDKIFVKPAFRSHLKGSDPTRELSREERETLKRRIALQPHLFVGQEHVELSSVPGWDGEKLRPTGAGFRVYVLATKDGYKVMPGGLVRITGGPGQSSISMQRGGSSKDLWVLSDEPVKDESLLRAPERAVELRRVGNNLPSRLADNFFWLGRYAERVDSSARLLRSALLRFSPETINTAKHVVEPLLRTLQNQGQIRHDADYHRESWNPDELESELLSSIFDEKRPGSLRKQALQLQRLGTLLRDRTSTDLWRVLSALVERLTPLTERRGPKGADALNILNQTILDLASFHGLARENMTRAQGWRFLDMGLRVERGIYICGLLGSVLQIEDVENPSVLEVLLEVADSTITYRSRYNVVPHLIAVYDLLLLDDTNPRSLMFQLNQLVKHFEKLPQEKESALPGAGQRLLLESYMRVRLVDPLELGRKDQVPGKSRIADVLEKTLNDLPRISEALALSYFAHSSIARSGAGGGR